MSVAIKTIENASVTEVANAVADNSSSSKQNLEASN